MSEDTSAENDQQDDTEGAESVEKPEVDWKARARDWEKKAKANFGAQAELDRLKDAQKTAEQRLTERAEAAERRAVELEADHLRAAVALDKGLTAKQAKRLVGNTREELEADADDLLADLKPGKPQGDIGQGHRETVKTNDMNSWMRRQVGVIQ